MPGKPPFSYAARGENPLVSTRADNHGVDFRTTPHYDEVCDHRGASVSEVDSESASAIGVHGVSASCRRMREVGSDSAVNGDGVDLSEPALAIIGSQSDANLRPYRTWSGELLTFDREPVTSPDQPIVTSLRIFSETLLWTGESYANENSDCPKTYAPHTQFSSHLNHPFEGLRL
jgi:hypothetical protein